MEDDIEEFLDEFTPNELSPQLRTTQSFGGSLDEDISTYISSPEEKSSLNKQKSKPEIKSRKPNTRSNSKPKLDLITGQVKDKKSKKKQDSSANTVQDDTKQNVDISSEKYSITNYEDLDPEITYPVLTVDSLSTTKDKHGKKRSNDAISRNLTNFTAKKKKSEDNKSQYKYVNTSRNGFSDVSTHPPQTVKPVIDITQSPISTNNVSTTRNNSRNHSNRRNRNRSANEDETYAHRLQSDERGTTFSSDEELARYLQKQENEAPRHHFHDLERIFSSMHHNSISFSHGTGTNYFNEVPVVNYSPLLSLFNSNRSNFFQYLINQRYGNGTSSGSGVSNNPIRNLEFEDRDFNENDYEMLLQLDETVKNNKGASQVEIDCLEKYTIKDTEKESCCICLAEMEPKLKVIKLPCGHLYHKDCITNWLKINSVCPMDKKSIYDEKR